MLCGRCDKLAGTYVPLRGAPRVCRRCGVQGVTERTIGDQVLVIVWDGSRG